ncbi:MAG: hypothetical protein NT045_04615 [Candidatus Aureabacteria bacterium]|nr:hypothetical protein [Candidatus Auribacterota bacterium]
MPAADKGWRTPVSEGLEVSDWSRPTNAYMEDRLEAMCPEEEQDYYNYGFNIPAGSIINGIEITMKIRGCDADSYMTCRLKKGTWPIGDEYWTHGEKRGPFGVAVTWLTFGGSTDLWGQAWTPSDFGTNFATDFAGYCSWIDVIKARVHYLPPPTETPTPTPAPYLRVIYPNGGETLTRGLTVTFRWQTVGQVGNPLTLGLLRGGSIYTTVNVTNTGAYTCVLPTGIPTGSNYQICVQSILCSAVWDASDGYFRIR